MPTDKQNVEFMWAIVKQLEVKHIDWNIVASANSISNGHAARMRFHRLRQAMEGIATKHRSPKTIDDSTEKPKAKCNRKTPKSRKAKELAMKRKLADISDDEEEPLANVKARMRMKEELEDSEDEYIDSETEGKRAVQKRIKQENNAAEWESNQDVFVPKDVKMEPEDRQTLVSGQQPTIEVKDENVM